MIEELNIVKGLGTQITIKLGSKNIFSPIAFVHELCDSFHTVMSGASPVQTRKLANAHLQTRKFASFNSPVHEFVPGNSRVSNGRVLHGQFHCAKA